MCDSFMNIEALIKSGNEYVRLGVEGRQAEASPRGLAACHLFGQAQKFAQALRSMCAEMQAGEREKLLVELWPLIVESVRDGETSQVDLAVRRICDTSANAA